MSQKRFRPLPSADEVLLLRAACLPKDEATQAWQQWCARHGVQSIAKTETDLMPAIFRNVGPDALGEDAPILRGTYRMVWVRNQMNFRAAAEVLRALRDQGTRTLLLKGAALTAQVYKDEGVRPMSDVDVIVPLDRGEATLRLLYERGWGEWLPLTGDVRHVQHVLHSTGLQRADGASIDLHWHVLADCCDEGDDEDFWASAVEIEFQGEPTLALCPADNLLVVLVHGLHWTEPRKLTWLQDAYRLIAGEAGAIDWDRLVRQATKRRLALPVEAGLRSLRDDLGADVPPRVLDALRSAPSTRIGRIDHRLQGTKDDFAGVALRTLVDYLKRSEHRPLADRALGLVWLTQALTHSPSLGQVPGRIAGRFVNRGREFVQGERA
ncbi:MAG TPA: nucleotidyltransferase family protein, partial [Dehalococcoidia bacterium]|nr:nucleotidyltransferase family protein [Dehalococcoidia bacterium]